MVATEPLSDVFFACALALYPVATSASHLAKMTRAYRAGERFELAGVVLARYGREGAARAEAEQASSLEGRDLVLAMRAEGTEAVIERFGRDGAFRMSRAVYVATIVVFSLAFVLMLVVAPL